MSANAGWAFEDFEMKRQAERSDRSLKSFDVRDRLILALYAQLKAERQTREAMEWVIRNGGLSPEVLEAMASDPVPVPKFKSSAISGMWIQTKQITKIFKTIERRQFARFVPSHTMLYLRIHSISYKRLKPPFFRSATLLSTLAAWAFGALNF